MTPLARSVTVRLVLVVGGILGGFVWLQEPVRVLEMAAARELLSAMGLAERFQVFGTAMVISPPDQPFFVAVLTAACSSLASVLTVAGIGFSLGSAPPLERLRAVTIACAVIIVGNLVRIVASLIAGLIAGRASLVLFHDVVGSALTFGYVLGGYVLMLWLLLPRGAQRERWEAAVVTA
jgi:exosortase/archaeosortase family protein